MKDVMSADILLVVSTVNIHLLASIVFTFGILHASI